ncbi:MAG: GTPase Era [Bacteroidota bacterium]
MSATPTSKHKAGFVSIVGKPNVGKSSLMNKLVGDNLSIITAKAQTTRQRIMGILNGEDFQIVYSDTPGILEPKYELHQAMMNYVKVSLEDADVILLVTELEEKYDATLFKRFEEITTPIIFLLNKADKGKGSQVEDKLTYWKEHIRANEYLPVSALTGQNLDVLLEMIKKYMPPHPGYYSKEDLTDRSERFFAAEIIREKIFLNYEQEVPYSTEVSIESFKDDGALIKMRAIIYVERDSQKGILIGKAGSSLKKVGTQARKDLENFFKRKVFLETHVKVADNWRKEKNRLRQFGYLE